MKTVVAAWLLTLPPDLAAPINRGSQPAFASPTSVVLVDPSLHFGGSPDANLYILHNGQTYPFQPRLLSSAPYYFDRTAFAMALVTLSPTSELNFTLPF